MRIIISLMLLLLVSCVSTNKTSSNLPIIDIEANLENFKISELSDYAKAIRYVPLETTENSLITDRIKNIYLENNRIFVNDAEPYIKVFDAETGKYLYNIGSKGQGPGELPHMSSVDINPFSNRVILSWGGIVNEFDFDGNFLGKIELPRDINDTEKLTAPVVLLPDEYYASIVQVFGDQKNLVYIFQDNLKIIDSLKCYENPTQHQVHKVWSYLDQGGIFYRSAKEMHYYRGFTDTIYAYNQYDKMFQPHFIIDYGKHKSRLDFNPGEESPDLIKIRSISENTNYVFLYFDTNRSSPEPFEDDIFRNGVNYKFTNQSIYGILDKRTQSFNFLLQPIPGLQGLKNDIDYGLPFSVRNTSTGGHLIDYYHAYKLLENADKLLDASESFVEMISKISEEDNPIVIIAE